MIKKLIIFFVLFSICNSCYAGVDFDGADDVISLPTSSIVFNAGNPFSFSCWVYWGRSGSNAAEFLYGGSQDWSGKIELNHDWKFLYFASDGDTPITSYSDDNAVPLNTWSHLVVTWDGSVTSTNVKFYVNGSLITYQGGQNGVNLGSDTGVKYLGNRNDGARPFDGIMNEVALWDVVLSATDITLLAKSKVKGMPLQIQPANLVLYLPMDDVADNTSADGSTFVDRSGTGNNGTGDDGANNTGLTSKAEEVLSYP